MHDVKVIVGLLSASARLRWTGGMSRTLTSPSSDCFTQALAPVSAMRPGILVSVLFVLVRRGANTVVEGDDGVAGKEVHQVVKGVCVGGEAVVQVEKGWSGRVKDARRRFGPCECHERVLEQMRCSSWKRAVD